MNDWECLVTLVLESWTEWETKYCCSWNSSCFGGLYEWVWSTDLTRLCLEQIQIALNLHKHYKNSANPIQRRIFKSFSLFKASPSSYLYYSPWYRGTTRFGDWWVFKCMIRILATVRVQIGLPLGVTVPKRVGFQLGGRSSLGLLYPTNSHKNPTLYKKKPSSPYLRYIDLSAPHSPQPSFLTCGPE